MLNAMIIVFQVLLDAAEKLNFTAEIDLVRYFIYTIILLNLLYRTIIYIGYSRSDSRVTLHVPKVCLGVKLR